jgi:iron(III) transport system substrate-binding protein
MLAYLKPDFETFPSRRGLVNGLAALIAVTLMTGPSFASDEVNVYSSRKEALIKPLLDRFTEDTGIDVKLVTGKPHQLIERMAAEGRNSPVDLLITADAGNLARAKAAGLLGPCESAELEAVISDSYRDPDKMWWGLSLRARVVVYAPDRVEADDLVNYEHLADQKWRDRLLVRSSSNVYNQSLIAAMISAHGEEQTETWARGVVANMARDPQGGDTDQIRAVAAGEGDIGIVNTYYYGRLAASSKPEDQEVVAKTRLFFPNQNGRGTHVNVSGAGVAAQAPNPENAKRLLEYLASAPAQALFAELNHEIPVRSGVPVSDIVASWGAFKKDGLPLGRLGELNRAAIELADRAGWR